MFISDERALFRSNPAIVLSAKTAPGTATTLRQRLQQSLACRLVTLAMGVAALHASTAAWADQAAIDAISALLDQGHLEQAAKQADAYAKNNPSDVQVRFLQGVIATEQGHNAKAIDIFTAISRDYPQLPEPFNNMAVLYAAQGQERKAVEVLESAIRTNPSYATAHENLGDLYARMASEAYTKALQLDDSRPALQPKLSLITQIVPLQEGAASAGEPIRVAQAAASERPAQTRETAQAEQARLAQQKQTDEQAKAARLAAEQTALTAAADKAAAEKAATEKLAAEKLVAERVAAEKVTAQKAAADKLAAEKASAETAAAEKVAAQRLADANKAAAQPAQAASANQAGQAKEPVSTAKAAERDSSAAASAAIQGVVQAWAKAWEGQNMPAYFAVYSADFKPADGSSLAQWKQQRTQRIVGRPTITVQLRNMRVSDLRDNTATVRFHQTYSAGAFKATTQKTLAMKKEGGQWRILNERTGG